MNTPISVSNGWWTFTNDGPLTTTYTPAPSCTSTDRLFLGYVSHGRVISGYGVQCTSDVNYYTCLPTPTTTITKLPKPPTHYDWAGIGNYYSPGLYCPSGWETVGVAARDASSSLSSSGILSTTPAITLSSSDPYSFYYPTATWTDAATILKSDLAPQQTMAVCCPSSFVADAFRGCYSIASDYKITGGCEVYTDFNYEYGETTVTYTHGSHTRTSVYDTPTTTIYKTSTATLDWDSDAKSVLTALSYVPMVTLVHHQSDLASASSAAAATGSKVNATGTAAAATSNAAVRSVGGRSGWDGAGGVVGVVMAAMALGAAIVFQ